MFQFWPYFTVLVLKCLVLILAVSNFENIQNCGQKSLHSKNFKCQDRSHYLTDALIRSLLLNALLLTIIAFSFKE